MTTINAVEANYLMSVRRGDVSKVKEYVEKSVVDINLDYQGTTALHLAAQTGNLPITEILLSHGADPHRMDKEGETPLALAAFHDHPSVVTRLFEAGAQISPVNVKGDTAFYSHFF